MHGNIGPRPWMIWGLRCAALHNLIWGGAVVAFPAETLSWAGLQEPMVYPQIWQWVGMIVGVFGIGYIIAAANPFRHWPIVLVGLLAKLLGLLGYLLAYVNGHVPASMGWMILLNDLIWCGPFLVILWSAFRYHEVSGSVHGTEYHDDDPIREIVTQRGENLHDLSVEQPQFVVFLRHAGCTFCRQSLSDLSQQRAAIEQLGAGIVLVHLGQEPGAGEFLARYGLEDLHRISDPRCRLYHQFGLETGRFHQLLGFKTWVRGVQAGLFKRHGIGPIAGNSFQMPGAFVIHCGRILHGFQHESASDRPDYLAIVEQALPVDQVAPSNR